MYVDMYIYSRLLDAAVDLTEMPHSAVHALLTVLDRPAPAS